MRRMVLATAVTLIAVLTLSTSATSAQVSGGGGAATGSGSTSSDFFEFDFDVRVDATGQPTGTVRLSVLGGSFTLEGSPSCVVIEGNQAIIGLVGSGAGGLRGVVIQVVDGGGPGSGLDTFDAFPDFSGAPGAITCTPQPASGGTTDVVTGDIVVQESPPLPTSKDECKKGGWQTFEVFKNQGDCVSFVATGGKTQPARS